MNVDPSNPSLVQVPGKPHPSAYRLKKTGAFPPQTMAAIMRLSLVVA